MASPKGSRTRVAIVVLMLCALAVSLGYGAYKFLGLDGPLLVIENESQANIESISYRDATKTGARSDPGSWPTLAPGKRIVRPFRGDSVVEITYTLRGQVRIYSEYTTAGPIEAWVVKIKDDRSAEGSFGLLKNY